MSESKSGRSSCCNAKILSWITGEQTCAKCLCIIKESQNGKSVFEGKPSPKAEADDGYDNDCVHGCTGKCPECDGEPEKPSPLPMNLEANSAMNRLIGYCESADFILKQTPAEWETCHVERKWVESLLKHARKLSEAL